MTADVTSFLRTMAADDAESTRRDLVTRDLLGGVTRSTKPDHRFDLLTTLKKSDQDPDPIQQPLDLKLLLSSPAAAPPPSDHQCTLEKVKSALERAGRESRSRRSDGSPSSSSSSMTSSSAGKRREGQEGEDGESGGKLTAAGCCNCLMFVLISSADPRCPRCDSHVPIPETVTKRRRTGSNIDLDLNSDGRD